MSRYRRPVTAERKAKAQAGRDQKLQELHEKLQDQVAALRTGEDWQRWLSFAARFHSYSFQNTLLIFGQRPDATTVAGYDAWQQMGRQVDKGQRGIAILAPVVRRPKRDDEDDVPNGLDDDATPQRTQPKVVGFQPTFVWDVSQTSGKPLPEQPKPRLLSGQAPAGLWDHLVTLLGQAGYQLERGDCGQANGITSPKARVVRIRDELDDAQAVKTLAHELGHVRLHCGDPAAVDVPCRGLREVEAESVAYLVTASHGLDSGSYTFPYVTAWAGHIAGVSAEEAVRQTGQRVLGAARWVLDATQARDDDAHAAEAARLADRVDAGTLTTSALRGRAEAVRVRADGTRPGRPVQVEPRDVSRAELVQLHREATTFFQARVSGSWVPEYLSGRGLDVALGEPWCAGWAPSGWTTLGEHLRAAGADDAALLASGLASPARTGSLIDRFRDRLMIPLRDATGDVVGFIGRSHPDADPARVPKYLNSPQTPVYAKGELLFGLPETRLRLSRGVQPVLVEGPLDAIAVTAGTGGRCAGHRAH